mgnify:CR=1 FL=1
MLIYVLTLLGLCIEVRQEVVRVRFLTSIPPKEAGKESKWNGDRQ